MPSTAPYGDRTLALAVAGTTSSLSRKKLLAFAVSVGVPERAAIRVLDEVLDGTASVVDDLRRYRRRVMTAT